MWYFMRISKELYNEILYLTQCPPPESGGLLGGHNGVVTLFVSDKGSNIKSSYKYEPDTVFLNKTINEWLSKNVDFLGIYHSHPHNCEALSSADIEYINEIMRCVNGYTDKLYFSIVIPNEKIISYYALIVADEIQIFQEAIQLK